MSCEDEIKPNEIMYGRSLIQYLAQCERLLNSTLFTYVCVALQFFTYGITTSFQWNYEAVRDGGDNSFFLYEKPKFQKVISSFSYGYSCSGFLIIRPEALAFSFVKLLTSSFTY